MKHYTLYKKDNWIYCRSI